MLGIFKRWLKNSVHKKVYTIRFGYYRTTTTAEEQMKKHKLTKADIEDAFRRGERVKPNKIVRKFKDYTVGIGIAQETETMYIITSCWKYEHDWMKPELYRG